MTHPCLETPDRIVRVRDCRFEREEKGETLKLNVYRINMVSDPEIPSNKYNTPVHNRERLDVPDVELSPCLAMLNVGDCKTESDPSRAGNRHVSTFAAEVAKPKEGQNVAREKLSEGDRGGLGRDDDGNGPSLMEQMMEEAMTARKEEAKKDRKHERQKVRKDFGGGLKKGFLSGSESKGKAKGKKKAGHTSRKNEATSQATVVTSTKKDMPIITGRKDPNSSASSHSGLEFDLSTGGSAVADEGLILPEVQEAMKSNAGNPLGGEEGNTTSWLTPELLTKISAKPRLAAMLGDPQFARAMALLATAPEEAANLFGRSTETRETFSELMGLLGDHFNGLDNDMKREEIERRKAAEGPLMQEALRRHAKVPREPPSREEEVEVQQILGQAELRELLLDPEMQRVLHKCGEPGKLRRYMDDPVVGPKIQKLAKAGLVSFQG